MVDKVWTYTSCLCREKLNRKDLNNEYPESTVHCPDPSLPLSEVDVLGLKGFIGNKTETMSVVENRHIFEIQTPFHLDVCLSKKIVY